MQSESRETDETLLAQAAKFLDHRITGPVSVIAISLMADFAIQHANRENARLIQLLTDIRFALGDDGKRMQDELVEYCKEVKAERDRLRGFVNEVYSFGLDIGHGIWQDGEFVIFDTDGEGLFSGATPLEAVEAYLNSKAGSGVEG